MLSKALEWLNHWTLYLWVLMEIELMDMQDNWNDFKENHNGK